MSFSIPPTFFRAEAGRPALSAEAGKLTYGKRHNSMLTKYLKSVMIQPRGGCRGLLNRGKSWGLLTVEQVIGTQNEQGQILRLLGSYTVISLSLSDRHTHLFNQPAMLQSTLHSDDGVPSPICLPASLTYPLSARRLDTPGVNGI